MYLEHGSILSLGVSQVQGSVHVAGLQILADRKLSGWTPGKLPHGPVRSCDGHCDIRIGRLSSRPELGCQDQPLLLSTSPGLQIKNDLILWSSPKSPGHWGHCPVCQLLAKHCRLQKFDSRVLSPAPSVFPTFVQLASCSLPPLWLPHPSPPAAALPLRLLSSIPLGNSSLHKTTKPLSACRKVRKLLTLG